MIARNLNFLVAAAPYAIAYYALAALSLLIGEGLSGHVAFWPSSGVLLAGLIRHPTHFRWLLPLGGLAAFCANLGAGSTIGISLAYAGANIVGPTVAFLALRALDLAQPTFATLAAVCKFSLAAVVGSSLSAALACSLTTSWAVQDFGSWFSTDVLGLFIVTPMIVAITEVFDKRASFARSDFVRATGIGTLVVIVSIAVFAQTVVPLLYLPSAIILVAAYQFRLAGATVGIFLIAMIGSIFSGLGLSSIHLVATSDFAGILYFQVYLLVMLASALWIAAIAIHQERMHRRVTRAYILLELAEESAHVGHWRLRLRDNNIFWSKEVFRIHGLEPGVTPPLDAAIEAYHPEDRWIVEQALASTMESGQPFAFEARLVQVGGNVRHVASQGQLQRDAHGDAIGLFGVVKDVTESVEATQALDEARRQAERSMLLAIEQAETDELTGLSSRRKILADLDVMTASATENSPVSVAMLDIDHFKSINDKFGHAIGDDVLRRVAQAIRQCVRDCDAVGRIGGEEFIVLLPGPPTQAASVADRIRRQIESSIADATLPTVTVSVGLASAASAKTNSSVLLQQADKALYQAKAEGRNRLTLAA